MPQRFKTPKPLCAYRIMWLFAMFDLPMKTREQRREYSRFRKQLLQLGFSQMQFSVYARHCPDEERMRAHVSSVHRILPPEGEVRILGVTDRQFGRMQTFLGAKSKPPQEAPRQLMLF